MSLELPMTIAVPQRELTDDAHLPSSGPSALEATVPAPPVKKAAPPWWKMTDGSHRGQRPRPVGRHKAPKDTRVYKQVMAIVALKAQGQKNAEVAETLQLSPHTIKTYLQRAHRQGWLNLDSFSDPDDQLDVVLRSKAIKNLNQGLDERTDEGRLTSTAVEMTLEVAKGTGMLKQHQVVKTDGTTNLGVALKVQVEMPPAGQPVARAGSIGGTPAFDVEVIEGE